MITTHRTIPVLVFYGMGFAGGMSLLMVVKSAISAQWGYTALTGGTLLWTLGWAWRNRRE